MDLLNEDLNWGWWKRGWFYIFTSLKYFRWQFFVRNILTGFVCYPLLTERRLQLKFLKYQDIFLEYLIRFFLVPQHSFRWFTVYKLLSLIPRHSFRIAGKKPVSNRFQFKKTPCIYSFGWLSVYKWLSLILFVAPEFFDMKHSNCCVLRITANFILKSSFEVFFETRLSCRNVVQSNFESFPTINRINLFACQTRFCQKSETFPATKYNTNYIKSIIWTQTNT